MGEVLLGLGGEKERERERKGREKDFTIELKLDDFERNASGCNF